MKKIYKYLFSILIGGALLSCADDNIINDTPHWQEGDTPYYIKLKLRSHSDSFTRADSNVPGSGGNPEFATPDEYAIGEKGNFAIFFDGDGKYISWSDLYSVNPTNTTPGMDATYTCRFYGFTDREPKKVLVVVNASDKIYKQVTTFPGWTLDEVYKQIWEECGKLHIEDVSGKTIYRHEDDPYGNLGFRFEEDGTRYFTMTNTTYVKDAAIHCAEDIVKIAKSQEELGSLEPTTVYLERMVSKFSMSLSFDAKEYTPVSALPLDVCIYENGEFKYYDYPWKIEILGWGLNGLETKSYLFKNLPSADGDWISHPGWNSVADRRSFWSRDPHYLKGESEYPWQFDEAKDKYDIDHPTFFNEFCSYDETQRNYCLTYYPMTRFCADVNDDASVDEGFVYNGADLICYTPENTFIPGLQVDGTRGTRAYELAGTHLLVAARILVDPEGGNQIGPYDGNIYRNRVGVCYIDEISMFEDFLNAINYKLTSQKYIYYKYYPWDEDPDVISDFHKNKYDYAQDLRAKSDGQYALYFQDPEDHKYYELTVDKLKELAYIDGDRSKGRNPKYKLNRDADALDADGKVIPWIMYNDPNDGKDDYYEACALYLLKKDENYKSFYEADDDITDLRLELQFKRFNENLKEDEWVDFENGQNGKDNNDLQSLFYEIWGIADDYNHGLMYYAIPIYAQDIYGLPTSGDIKQLEDPFAGIDDPSFYYYYGVVRNNWYHFTLHSISAFGQPVTNPEKPIVPNYNNKKNQVKVEMELLPMHIQNIEVTMP